MSYIDLLIHTVNIETVTDDYSGGDGSSVKTWAVASVDDEDVACRRIDIRGSFEEAIAGRNKDSTHKFLFKSGQSITEGQRINEDGTYYIITFAHHGSTRIVHHKTAYAKLIQGTP